MSITWLPCIISRMGRRQWSVPLLCHLVFSVWMIPETIHLYKAIVLWGQIYRVSDQNVCWQKGMEHDIIPQRTMFYVSTFKRELFFTERMRLCHKIGWFLGRWNNQLSVIETHILTCTVLSYEVEYESVVNYWWSVSEEIQKYPSAHHYAMFLESGGAFICGSKDSCDDLNNPPCMDQCRYFALSTCHPHPATTSEAALYDRTHLSQ